jgi:hypothetical protein
LRITDCFEGGCPFLCDRGEQASRVIEEYDPEEARWTTKAMMPTGRGSPGVVAYNGEIYVIGGIANGAGVAVVEVYDPVNDTWRTAAPLPEAQSDLSAVVLNDKIYAMAKDGIFAYDPNSNSWSTIGYYEQTLTTPISFARSAAFQDSIYIFGGVQKYGTSPVNIVRRFTPSSCTTSISTSSSSATSSTSSTSTPVSTSTASKSTGSFDDTSTGSDENSSNTNNKFVLVGSFLLFIALAMFM